MLTFRVFCLSAGAIFVGAWFLQRVELVYGGPSPAGGVMPPLALFFLAALILFGQVTRRLGMGQGELLSVYLMVAVGLPFASTGLVHYLLPGLVTGFYSFADETGRYFPFLRYVPTWMAPGPINGEVASGFFEGRPSGVPWEAWIRPLAGWTILVAALFTTFFGLVCLLERRWLEQEHLRFPLTEVPLGLLEKGGALLGNRTMWVGFALPALIYGLNGIHHYFLVPGEIPLYFDFGEVLLDAPWSAMAPILRASFSTFPPFW